jgi:DNA-binding NarL/FixJ family response regulator
VDPLARASTRVLLMDDHADFVRAASDFLERCQDLVLVGTLDNCADDFLAQVTLLDPQVILIDLEMHSPGGMATIPRLRQALPQTAIIALTLLDSHIYRKAALSAGADDLIAKADLIRHLPCTIDRVLCEGRSLLVNL